MIIGDTASAAIFINCSYAKIISWNTNKCTMDRQEAFHLFEKMIRLAEAELHRFTKSQRLCVHHKADRTVVTGCDRRIDEVLSEFAKSIGLLVVSEEGDKEKQIVSKGDYVTIDPIDGSLGYIEYVNYAVEHGGINAFLSQDLGPASDFCLLLGIVEDGTPRFGCCYHYVTKERILLDAQAPGRCTIQNRRRKNSARTVVYVDPRPGEEIQQRIARMPDVKTITQATLGLKSLFTIINDHKDAITIHRVQHAGLWDILPTAVAVQAFGGILLDDKGDEVVYDDYVILPGKGATCIKGKRFLHVKDELRRIHNE